MNCLRALLDATPQTSQTTPPGPSHGPSSPGTWVRSFCVYYAEPLAVEATGAVWTSVLEAADRHDATAIVMGAAGVGGARPVVLGGVSSAVTHRAGRPTLVIPQPLADAPA
jgi:predicted dinucleotide-binding enzyme